MEPVHNFVEIVIMLNDGSCIRHMYESDYDTPDVYKRACDFFDAECIATLPDDCAYMYASQFKDGDEIRHYDSRTGLIIDMED